MKKGISVVATIVFVLLLGGCNLLPTYKIYDAFTNMNELDSYQMGVSYKIDEETAIAYYYIDGDYMEIVMDWETKRYYELDDTWYSIYSRYGLTVARLDGVLNTAENQTYNDFTIFQDQNYEKDDAGYYIFTGDDVYYDNVDTIKIKIDDDMVTNMDLYGYTYVMGIKKDMEIRVTFSKFNDVELETPEIYVYHERIEEITDVLQTWNIDTMRPTDDGFEMLGDDFNVTCDLASKVCVFSNGVDLLFDTDTELITLPDNREMIPFVYDKDIANTLNITPDFFDLIVELSDYYYTELFEIEFT